MPQQGTSITADVSLLALALEDEVPLAESAAACSSVRKRTRTVVALRSYPSNPNGAIRRGGLSSGTTVARPVQVEWRWRCGRAGAVRMAAACLIRGW
jgi:hypothetical protein